MLATALNRLNESIMALNKCSQNDTLANMLQDSVLIRLRFCFILLFRALRSHLFQIHGRKTIRDAVLENCCEKKLITHEELDDLEQCHQDCIDSSAYLSDKAAQAIAIRAEQHYNLMTGLPQKIERFDLD